MNKLLAHILLLCCIATQAQQYVPSATFGTDGGLSIDPGPGSDEFNHHHAQPDGNLVLTGTGYDINTNSYHVSMLRIDPECGAVDETFGTLGTVQHYHQGRTVCKATALQDDGKILGCGMIAPDNSGSQQWPGVFRYNADGSVDSTFNGTGYRRLQFVNGAGDFNKVWVHADSTITCAGAGFNGQLGAYRFTHDGQLDTTFGNNGAAFINAPNFNLSGEGSGLLLPDSSVISIVIGNNGSIYNITMAKFDHEGVPDSTFGVNGLVVSGIEARMQYALGSALQDDGRILVSCYFGQNSFLMARFMPDGSTDLSYGTNGVSIVPIAFAEGQGMELLPDGSTLQFGRQNGEGTVLKRDVNGAVVSTFGSGGFQDATVLPLNDNFMGGFTTATGAIIGYGGSTGGATFVARMAPMDQAEVLPVISLVDNALRCTGVGQFAWYLNGDPIEGETGNSIVPTVNGTYTVVLALSENCQFTSAPFDLLTIGLMEQTSSAVIEVITNPASGVLVVHNHGDRVNYVLFDMTGKRLAHGLLGTGRNELPIQHLSQGIYLFRAENGSRSSTDRIIVE